MTDREAFEAHYKHLDLETDKDAWGRDKYKHQCIDAMWAGWQAATAAERERCAKVCEDYAEGSSYRIRPKLAEAIRKG